MPKYEQQPGLSRTTSLFALTLGLSAALLFWIQPLVAKSLLPTTGGSPAIWHTVIVFFQTTLLLGYLYAHVLVTKVSLRHQALVHFGLLATAILVFLPQDRFDLAVSVSTNHPERIPGQLWLGLITSIGLPCLLVSSTSPLLQSWYRHCQVPDANDPYFLYSASNVGSLATLLAFPLFTESYLGLSFQFQYWSIGFTLLCFLAFTCYSLAQGGRNTSSLPPLGSSHPTERQASPIKWFGYAFLGSSVMIGATTFLTTNVMNAPLMGVLPLAVFLITYILAFAKRPLSLCSRAAELTLIAIMAVLFQIFSSATDPAWLVTGIHLSLVFFSCLLIHRKLATSRPRAAHITAFYLWISVGGVAAGVSHTFVAPIVFDRIWEYPLTILALCLISGRTEPSRPTPMMRSLGWGSSFLGLLLFACFAASRSIAFLGPFNKFPNPIIGITLAGAFLGGRTPIRLTAVLTCLFALNAWRGDAHGKTLFIDRNFYGQSRITLDPNGLTKRLIHGNTIHGRQSIEKGHDQLPLSYYHTAGPLRRIFKQYEEIESQSSVALVGLGAGSMLYYAEAHQSWSVFEIDPLVIQLAKDSRYFSYISNSKAGSFRIKAGDARVQLANEAEHSFDLILLDAFSSDSIPMHLFTKEAVELYLSKLANDGLLAFHISNRTLNLAPALSRLIDEFQLQSLAWNDPHESAELGKDPSHWVAVTRNPTSLDKLRKDDRWLPLETPPNTPLWTDERSNILDAMNFD